MLDRIRICLPAGADADVRKMFGLDAFVCRGLMFAAILNEDLLLRLDSAGQEEALGLQGAMPWSPELGEETEYVRVPGVHVSTDEILRQWLARAYDYTESLSSPHLAGAGYGDEDEPPEDLTGGYSEQAVEEPLPRVKAKPVARPPVRKIPVKPVAKAAPKKPAKKKAARPAVKAAPMKPAKKKAAGPAVKAAPKKAKKAAAKATPKKKAKKAAKKATRKAVKKAVRKAPRKTGKKPAKKVARRPARKAKAAPKKKAAKKPARRTAKKK